MLLHFLYHDALMFHTFCKHCIIWELSVFSSTLMLNISCGYSCFHLMYRYLLQGHVLDQEWGRTGLNSNHIKINISPFRRMFWLELPSPCKISELFFHVYSDFITFNWSTLGAIYIFSLKLISLNLCQAKTQVSFSTKDFIQGCSHFK